MLSFAQLLGSAFIAITFLNVAPGHGYQWCDSLSNFTTRCPVYCCSNETVELEFCCETCSLSTYEKTRSSPDCLDYSGKFNKILMVLGIGVAVLFCGLFCFTTLLWSRGVCWWGQADPNADYNHNSEVNPDENYYDCGEVPVEEEEPRKIVVVQRPRQVIVQPVLVPQATMMQPTQPMTSQPMMMQQPQPMMMQQPQPMMMQQPQPMMVQQPQPMMMQQSQPPMMMQQPQPMMMQQSQPPMMMQQSQPMMMQQPQPMMMQQPQPMMVQQSQPLMVQQSQPLIVQQSQAVPQPLRAQIGTTEESELLPHKA